MAVREFEEEESSSYFASGSDLMVGILFVFLLMLTVFAFNYRETEHKQDVSRAELEEAKEEARQQAARADRLHRFLEEKAMELQRAIDATTVARDRLLTKLETTLAERGVRVWIDRQAGILHLPGDLLFATNSASLTPTQRENVDILGDAPTKTLPCFTPISDRTHCEDVDLPILETVLIEGHTDRRPIAGGGQFRDNDQLSTERALAVFTELKNVQPGLDSLLNADRTYPLLGVSGFGAKRPLPQAQGDNDSDYALNRRIDLRFLLARSAELERLRSEIDRALTESKK